MTESQPFISNTAIPHFDEGGADALGPDDGFWDPHRAPRLRSGDVQLPGARFLVVAIDESRPDIAVVYVINHGT